MDYTTLASPEQRIEVLEAIIPQYLLQRIYDQAFWAAPECRQVFRLEHNPEPTFSQDELHLLLDALSRRRLRWYRDKPTLQLREKLLDLTEGW
jgi:hypothetical protein